MTAVNQSLQSSSLPIASLYVGDLSTDVTEAMLFEKFSQIGPVLSIRVCRDVVTRRSLGYAYVNFQNSGDADKAIEQLNFEPIKGDKPMRIMWTQRDPSLRKSGVGNIFIKNLDKTIDNKALCDTFGAFGKILSCKIALDDKGKSLGYGFVHYEKQEHADSSIAQLNGKLLNDKQVFVGPFIPKKERDRATDGKRKFTNLYIKHIHDNVTDDQLKELFSKFGTISSVFLQKDTDGKSKKFGFVSFEDPEAADKAYKEMHNKEDIPEVQEGKKLYIAPAKKKTERQQELRDKFDRIKQERANRYQGVNLYIKNLDDDIDDAELRKAFEQFGTVTSAKVMMTENSTLSRGFGFVCFSSPEEATKAVTEMNGRIVKSKPLYVALAQRKDERQAQLNQMYSQRTMPSVRVGPTSQIPPIFGGYQPFLNPTQLPHRGGMFPVGRGNSPRWPASAAQMRPGPPQALGLGNPGFMRATTPRASLQRPNIQPGANMAQGGRMPLAAHNQMMRMPSAQVIPNMAMQQPRPRYQPNMQMNARLPAAAAQAPVPNGAPQGLQGAGAQGDGNEQTLAIDATYLASLPANQQKQTIGEFLYPVIGKMQGPELAGRITGMLLELDNSDLLDMMQAHKDGGDELQKKVEEAYAVIKAHAEKEKKPNVA